MSLLLWTDPLRDATGHRAALAAAEAAVAPGGEPRCTSWRHALAARRAVLDGDPAAAGPEITSARAAAEATEPAEEQALLLAYLAHVEMSADRIDSALLLAADASLLTGEPAAPASAALLQAHRWLALTLAGLGLDELALPAALRGCAVADRRGRADERWRLLQLAAQRHAELARALLARGPSPRAGELAAAAIDLASAARELDERLDEEPEADEQHLLDLVQAGAMACRGEPEEALGPLRRVRRRAHEASGPWLRGYADLGVAQALTAVAEQARREPANGSAADADALTAQALDLLADAAGAFAAAGDRRRYRDVLLDLGRLSTALRRAADAVHWLAAYRAEAGQAQARGRQLEAETFVRRSRWREAERSTAVLRRHALEDPLTGLGNRRSAEQRLGTLRPGSEPLSLAVVDVDRFKKVNDDSSHSSGDAVLRRVADLLREHSRAGDEVYRWAGDEFLVVLPTATEEQAVGVMERLRAAVEQASWADLRLTAPVTVSIGVACAPGGSEHDPGPTSWRALFDAADLRLFAAKRAGRNRIEAPGGHWPSGESGPGAESADRPA